MHLQINTKGSVAPGCFHSLIRSQSPQPAHWLSQSTTISPKGILKFSQKQNKDGNSYQLQYNQWWRVDTCI